MSLLVVDQNKCDRDGMCIAVCPAEIIAFTDNGSFPSLIDGGEELCIKCGHCVAVCPQGAMTHQAMKPADCPPLKQEWILKPAHVEHFLRSRRSIRKYKKAVVGKGILTKLIDIARFAPSGHNLQPVNWLVVYDAGEIRKLSDHVVDWMRHLIQEGSPLAAAMHLDRVVSAYEKGKDRICRGAPHVIVTHAHKDERSAPAACTIALTFLDLATMSFGLGACWAGYFNAAANFWPPMQKALNLPKGHISFGAMMIGYPKFQYKRLPLRNEPKITWR